MEQKRKKQYIIVWCLIGTILIIDQVVKIMVKTHMHIGEEIPFAIETLKMLRQDGHRIILWSNERAGTG